MAHQSVLNETMQQQLEAALAKPASARTWVERARIKAAESFGAVTTPAPTTHQPGHREQTPPPRSESEAERTWAGIGARASQSARSLRLHRHMGAARRSRVGARRDTTKQVTSSANSPALTSVSAASAVQRPSR